MIFVFGPYAAGKRETVKRLFDMNEEIFAARCVCDVQDLAAEREDVEALAEELSRYNVVIATETGGGIVPVEENARRARERAGTLNRLLAEKADTVIRVFYGIPVALKGKLPC